MVSHLLQVTFKQTESDVLLCDWTASSPAPAEPAAAAVAAARDYLALDTLLAPLVSAWSKADAQCALLSLHFPGLRVRCAH